MQTSTRAISYWEVLQTEFRFDFRKGPCQISAGPGWSTPVEEVEPNFSFCKPNFLCSVRFDREACCTHVVVLASRRIVMSKIQEDNREVESLLPLDHYW